jgi:hypothetical protein
MLCSLLNGASAAAGWWIWASARPRSGAAAASSGRSAASSPGSHEVTAQHHGYSAAGRPTATIRWAGKVHRRASGPIHRISARNDPAEPRCRGNRTARSSPSRNTAMSKPSSGAATSRSARSGNCSASRVRTSAREIGTSAAGGT